MTHSAAQEALETDVILSASGYPRSVGEKQRAEKRERVKVSVNNGQYIRLNQNLHPVIWLFGETSLSFVYFYLTLYYPR